jgi:hypothetical protein
MVLTQFPVGATLYGVDWEKVQSQSDPNYVIEYTLVKCSPHRITVRSVTDRTEKTFHSALVFRESPEQCHRDVQKWLGKEMGECSGRLSRLQRFLALAQAAAAS